LFKYNLAYIKKIMLYIKFYSLIINSYDLITLTYYFNLFGNVQHVDCRD